jgi:hypothetical protein
MTDKYSQFELDDELLSAYIDGELTADERAAVEARLATDPAAQQLLHELRSVAQDVQSLPTERVGRDLSDEILRRVAPKKAAAAPVEPSPSPGPMPKLTIFGNRRSWMWASLALAAGLLIMIVQSGDERGQNMAPVARRVEPQAGEVSALKSDKDAGRESAIAQSESKRERWETPATLSAAKPDSTRLEGGVQRLEQLANSTQQNAPAGAAAPASAPTAGSAPAAAGKEPAAQPESAYAYADRASEKTPADGKQMVDKLGAKPQVAAGTGIASGAARFHAAGGKLDPAAAHDELIVVRVVAKRDALQNKLFDELLANLNIDVETEPAKAPASTSASELATRIDESRATAADKSGPAHESDVVLVEAPEPAIANFLDVINKDTANFVGIDVSDSATARELAAFKKPVKAKAAEDLSRFSRGAVPHPASRSADDYAHYYNEIISDAASSAPAPGLAGSPGAAAPPAPVPAEQKSFGGERADNKSKLATPLGRARRLVRPSAETLSLQQKLSRSGGVAGQLSDEAKRVPSPARQLKELEKLSESSRDKPTAPQPDLRVLFVLSPEEAATPSTPPANPPK